MPTVIKFPSIKALQTVIKGLSEIVDGCVFTFTPEGVRLVSLDISHVALCDLTLTFMTDSPKYIFDPAHDEACINLRALSSVLTDVDRQSGTEELRWTIDMATDSMCFDRFDGSLETFCDRWRLKTINIDNDERCTTNDIADSTPSSRMVISSKYFRTAITSFDILDNPESILFEVDYVSRKFTISSEGSQGECSRVLSQQQDTKRIDFVSGTDKILRAHFSLDYIKRFIKASTVADTIEITLTKVPNDSVVLLTIEYAVSDFGRMKFFVPSKVCGDDSDDDVMDQ